MGMGRGIVARSSMLGRRIMGAGWSGWALGYMPRMARSMIPRAGIMGSQITMIRITLTSLVLEFKGTNIHNEDSGQSPNLRNIF